MSAEADERGRAKTDFEVDDLVRALRSYGVLTRDALREQSGARHWPDHGFDQVLRRGVAAGSIKDLGDDMFEVGESAPDPSDARFGPT